MSLENERTLARPPMTKQHQGRRKPKSVRNRRFAEDCQHGDLVKWTIEPNIRQGEATLKAPSTEAVITMFVGPEPFTAFARFIVNGRELEPVQVVRGQPLVVMEARK